MRDDKEKSLKNSLGFLEDSLGLLVLSGFAFSSLSAECIIRTSAMRLAAVNTSQTGRAVTRSID